MASSDPLVELFKAYQECLDVDQKLREEIRKNIEELDQIARQINTTQQGVHLENGLNQIDQITQKTDELFAKCEEPFTRLTELVPIAEYYKFNDHWKWVMQKLVFSLAFNKFLTTGEIIFKEDAAAKLSIKNNRQEGFHLDLEDYLHGLLKLASELSRLAVTSATAGDYSMPVRISQFVSELNAGFTLLNFKNDSLRKHFDALKYDRKKIEEVVFDLSIRGLKTE